jgi:hypothetical protein
MQAQLRDARYRYRISKALERSTATTEAGGKVNLRSFNTRLPGGNRFYRGPTVAALELGGVGASAHCLQADALEIEAACKRRLADEYHAAQARGDDARRLRDAEAAEPGMIRRCAPLPLHASSVAMVLLTPAHCARGTWGCDGGLLGEARRGRGSGRLVDQAGGVDRLRDRRRRALLVDGPRDLDDVRGIARFLPVRSPQRCHLRLSSAGVSATRLPGTSRPQTPHSPL